MSTAGGSAAARRERRCDTDAEAMRLSTGGMVGRQMREHFSSLRTLLLFWFAHVESAKGGATRWSCSPA